MTDGQESDQWRSDGCPEGCPGGVNPDRSATLLGRKILPHSLGGNNPHPGFAQAKEQAARSEHDSGVCERGQKLGHRPPGHQNSHADANTEAIAKGATECIGDRVRKEEREHHVTVGEVAHPEDVLNSCGQDG